LVVVGEGVSIAAKCSADKVSSVPRERVRNSVKLL